MLQSREVVDAHAGRQLCILLAVGCRVDQRARPAPVLVGGVRLEELRHDAVPGGTIQQPLGASRDRVAGRQVGEREQVGRIEDRVHRLCVPGGLGKAMVEATAAGAGDVGHHAVEGDPAGFVRVEPLIEQVTQEASRLRDAEDQCPLHRRHGRWIVFGIRGEIAHGDEAQPDKRRILRRVDQLVDPPRLETGGMANARDLFAFGDERPLIFRDRRSLAVGKIADGQTVARIVRVRDRVLLAADAPDDQVTDRLEVGLLRQGEVRAHEAGHPGSGRRVEAQQSFGVAGVELPAEPDQREALTHQEAVAEVRLLGRIDRAASLIEQGKHALAAAVRDLHQQRPVALRRILRTEHVEVRGEGDLSPLVGCGSADIDDRAVESVVRGDGEVDRADDLLVATGKAEGLAVEDVLALLDLHSGDSRLGNRREGNEEQQGERRGQSTDANHGHGRLRRGNRQIRPQELCGELHGFLVAGAGFEPATFGL